MILKFNKYYGEDFPILRLKLSYDYCFINNIINHSQKPNCCYYLINYFLIKSLKSSFLHFIIKFYDF